MRKIALVLAFIIFFNLFLYLIRSSLNQQAYAQNTSALQAAMDKTPSQTSAYAFKDDGTVAEKNGASALPAFSVIKLWIAAATLNLAEGGSLNLGETVAGKTIDQHLNLMLIESNNDSANALIDKIGFDAINAYIQANGYKETVLNRRMLEDPKIRGDNLTSGRDAAVFMFNLVSKKIASEEYSNKLISILQARTAAKKDFMPEPLSLARAGFFGKSGTQADAGPIRNNAGTFVDSSGQRVFFAVLVPNANSADEAIQAIQGVESAAYSGGAAGSNPTNQAITIIGDSLTERASGYIKTSLPNASIDGKVSRQWDEGATILQDIASGGKLPPVIVFALGTNGATDEAGIDKVMQLAGNSKVVFMTVYGSSDADKQNSLIRNAVTKYSGKIAVADWNSAATSNPDWFKADPVHPDDAGTQAFAQLIRNAVSSASSGTTIVTLASCKFYRPDQTPGSGNCPPETEGTDRCAPGLSFKSPLLVSYIEEASKITGVPATILAGVVRIESTVPQKYSLTGKSYSISDYTDEDIKAMEEFSKTADGNNIDSTIGSTNKALCPHSTTGALGITQIQPYGTTGNNSPDGKNASVEKAAEYLAKATGIQKTNTTLSYQEYCNPRYSIILSGGFILGKLGKDEDPWKQPPTQDAYKEKVLRIARLYYGEDDQLEVYRQGLWQGVNECKAGTIATTTGSLSGSVKSNRLCVKVGNPTDPKPATCSTTPGTSVGGGLITPPVTGPAPTVEAGKLVDAIKEQFGVTMQGAWDEKHLRWTYEKFYELSQTTKFIDYIRGQPVELINGVPNQESGHVQMSQTGYYADDKDYYLGTLIHEFGHVIYHKPLPANLAGEVNNVYEKVKCLSTYSRCQYDRSENYPEVIAYCLNPKAVGAINQERWPSYRDLAVRILGFCYN